MRTLGLVLLLGAAAGCDQAAPTGPAPVPVPDEPAGPRAQIDNPQYQSWAAFPKGTTVVHRSVTRTDGMDGETVTTTTYTLVEVAPEQVVVELRTATRRFDGLETKNPPGKYAYPRRLVLPPGARPEEPREQGEELVQAGGKAYRARWHKAKDRNEAGEVLTQVWSSPEVPGGLVKSVMSTPAIGAATTTELVEVRTP